MTLKFSQITASVANFTTADSLIGLQNSTSDRLFSLPQIASAILTSPNITGHATIEGVALSGVTGTGSLVLDHTPTIGTATLNRPTLNTATINTSTLANSTINTATINNATLNTAVLNTAVINTSTLNAPTLNNAVLSAPVMTNAVISTATINTGTFNNVTINTAAINNATLATAVINTGTINNATINTAVIGTSTINNSTVGTATINNSTLGTAVINNSTMGTATINNSTLGTATINNSTLNTATINTGTLNNVLVNPSAATTGFILKSNGTLLAPTWVGGAGVLLNTITAAQLGSAVDTTSLTSTYSRYRITFENVCPVSTATLTCSLNLQVATTGTSWISASYVSNISQFVGATTVLAGTTSLFLLSGLTATTCVGTSTLYGVNGYVELVNPASTIIRKSVRGELNYMTPGAVSTSTLNTVIPSGFWDGNSNAIVSIALAFQTGNISTGTFKVYGIS